MMKEVQEMEKQELIQMAMDAMEQAYAPYSGFHVGAALVTADGMVYTGCNVENASYPAGICGERTAIAKAVSDGRQQFKEIVITGGPNGVIKDYCPPCGICRQVLREFANPKEFKVILAKNRNDYQEYTLAQLLPESFGPDNLNE